LISIKSPAEKTGLVEQASLQRESPMNQSQSTKWMTHGEASLFVFFAVSAFLCMIAAAKAIDAPFAFHASPGLGRKSRGGLCHL
jgi:hypothetical protein